MSATPPSTAARRPGALRPRDDGVHALRVWICVATVIVCLPYTLLKAAWVTGWSVGASIDGFTDTTRVANGVTGALDLVAILVAITFVAPWGRRIPAFLVAFPAWIASGLLAPVAVGFVIGTPLQLATGGDNPFTRDDGLSPWVFGLVYGGFVLQAALLVPGFVLYARDRWSVATRGGRASGGAGTTGPLQDLLGGIFVVAATAFAGLQLSWSLQGSGSYPDPNTPQRTLFAASAIAALAAAVATIRLMRGGRLTRLRLGTIWLGSGITFTSTLSDTLRSVATDAGAWAATSSSAAEATLILFVLLGTLGGAIGGAMRLVEEEGLSPAPSFDQEADPGVG